MELKDLAETADARIGIPRPANEQFLSSYQAFLRVVSDGAKGVLSVLFAVGSVLLLIYALGILKDATGFSFFDRGGALAIVLTLLYGLAIFACLSIDVGQLFTAYRLELQRETHGSRVWAKRKNLKTAGLLVRKDKPLAQKGIRLAPFGLWHELFISAKRLAESIVIFGPPGSGKSSTFFMPVIRQFSSFGGAIVLDVKGELYEYTAREYSNIFRLDIQNVFCSDWFNLFGGCRRNPDYARRLATYLVGYDPNAQQTKDPFWPQTAVTFLECMILFVCESNPRAVPRDIMRLMAKGDRKFKIVVDPETGEKTKVNPLNHAMATCPYAYVGEKWNSNFASLAEETFTSITINANTALSQLMSPKIAEVLRAPTDREIRMGRREIDFDALRKFYIDSETGQKRGTGLFVVVSPGDSKIYNVFLRVFFSVALDKLRMQREGEVFNPVLTALDEAGNVPLDGLPEGINTDRSKGICYMLGYQDLTQSFKQYGKDGAKSFLGSVAVDIFMPGVDDDTAKYASEKVGDTTFFQRTISDARNDNYDQNRLAESGRKLIMPTEITDMKRFTQCVITLKGARPVRAGVPVDAKVTDARRTKPSRLVDRVSQEVEREYGIRFSENKGYVRGTQVTTVNDGIPGSEKEPDVENKPLIGRVGADLQSIEKSAEAATPPVSEKDIQGMLWANEPDESAYRRQAGFE